MILTFFKDYWPVECLSVFVQYFLMSRARFCTSPGMSQTTCSFYCIQLGATWYPFLFLPVVLAITTWLRWYLPGTYVLPFVINRYFFREWLWKYVKSSSVHYHTLSLTVIDVSHMYNILQQRKLPNYGFDFSLTIILSAGRKSFIFSQFVYSLIYLCQCGLKRFLSSSIIYFDAQPIPRMASGSYFWPASVPSIIHWALPYILVQSVPGSPCPSHALALE